MVISLVSEFYQRKRRQRKFKAIIVGFQPSQNVIVRPWVYMSFIIIQIYFHALIFSFSFKLYTNIFKFFYEHSELLI